MRWRHLPDESSIQLWSDPPIYRWFWVMQVACIAYHWFIYILDTIKRESSCLQAQRRCVEFNVTRQRDVTVTSPRVDNDDTIDRRKCTKELQSWRVLVNCIHPSWFQSVASSTEARMFELTLHKYAIDHWRQTRIEVGSAEPLTCARHDHLMCNDRRHSISSSLFGQFDEGDANNWAWPHEEQVPAARNPRCNVFIDAGMMNKSIILKNNIHMYIIIIIISFLFRPRECGIT